MRQLIQLGELITKDANINNPATLKAAFRDLARGEVYDVSDSKVNGLQLRVKPRAGVRWSVRTRFRGEQRRYDLGPAVQGDVDVDVDGVCLATARSRANTVIEMARAGQDPTVFLAALAAGVSIDTQLKREAEKPLPSWTWQDGKKAFLAEVERTNRWDTFRDCRGKFQPRERDRFEARWVNTIGRNEMAAAIAEVHARGAEPMAEGMVRTIRRFFNWLAEPVRQGETNVEVGIIQGPSPHPR